MKADPPDELVARLGISQYAAELFCESEVFDLHIESYSFYRALGYHPHRRHHRGPFGGMLFGQADLPRLIQSGIGGATWVITANPLRPPEDRDAAFTTLLTDLTELLDDPRSGARVVRNVSEYERARREGKHACFLGVQGANAFPPDPSVLARYAPHLLRITLLHMNDTYVGATSAPGIHPKGTGLGPVGFSFVEEMNRLRIGVDLAHIHPHAFWDALRVHRVDVPALVTHTGVSGVFPHWRNLDDRQLRAVAATGGTIGIMYHAMYLGDPLLSGKSSSIVRHIVHALDVVGEDHVSLGSDWDGLICTPRDMPTCRELPLLVEGLLRAGVRDRAVVKILGQNALRVVKDLKGT